MINNLKVIPLQGTRTSKEATKKILLFGFVILLITGIFASYTLGNPEYSIQETYSKGANIRGWINLSFQDEPITSVFTSSFGNSIMLIDLLETPANSKINYTCNPANCQSSYIKTNPETQKQITLNAGQKKLIGFVLNDNIEEIAGFNLTIVSDAVKSDENQLKIDLFNDGIKDIGNTKSYNQTEEWSAPRDYACFNPYEQQIMQGSIKNGDVYCQRVNLPEAPGFSLGAWLKKKSSSDLLNLKMYLYDIDLEEEVKSCNLPDATTTETAIYCDIEYLITKQKDYYVCLSAEGTGTYKMQTYGYINRCGFNNLPPNEEIAAYKIFIQPRFFDAIGTLEIPDTLPEGTSISKLIENYIDEKYNNLSCAGRNCIIPIKLISNVSQTLTITGELEYNSPYNSGLEEKKIYDLSEDAGEITADRQKIFLDNANFSVPNDIGEHTFKLSLDNTEILTEQIEIKKGIEILSINPVKTAAGLPTNFKVKVNANNITIAKYKWDFNNDGTIDKTTFTNSVKHTYNSTKNYNLIISVEDYGGVSSSESFNIEVGSAKDVLDSLIAEKQEDLSDIKGEILNYDPFSIGAINNVSDLNGIEQKLNNLKSNYLAIKNTGTAQEFQTILSDLLEIELPKSIKKTLDSASLTFFPKKDNLDLDIIESIAGGSSDADLEEEYKDSILTWNLNNVQTKVSVKEYSADYNLGKEMLVKTFKLNIKNSGAQENLYLFIKEMEGINFKENMIYDDSGYYSKKLSINSEEIEFYTTEDIDIENLPVFISPSLDELDVNVGAGTTPDKAGKKFKWGIFALIIIFVILLGIGVYFILKKWYKEKYENYLFKNKNNLYNIVTYVHGAKQHGKKDNEIVKDLRNAGWNNEQINYVMKKYSGKNTGMPGSAEKSFVNKNKMH